MKSLEYADFLIERLAGGVVKAWQNRKPGAVSWALGHAVVGHNRKAVYFDGTAKMYGKTNKPDFRHIEGYEDHAVEILFFWDSENKMTGVVLNIACPSQETAGG